MRIMSFSGLFSRLSFTGSDKATRASRDAEEEVSSTEQFPPLAVKVNGFLEEGVEGGKQNGVATLEQEPTPTRPKSKPPVNSKVNTDATFQSPRQRKISMKGRKTSVKNTGSNLSPTVSFNKKKQQNEASAAAATAAAAATVEYTPSSSFNNEEVDKGGSSGDTNVSNSLMSMKSAKKQRKLTIKTDDEVFLISKNPTTTTSSSSSSSTPNASAVSERRRLSTKQKILTPVADKKAPNKQQQQQQRPLLPLAAANSSSSSSTKPAANNVNDFKVKPQRQPRLPTETETDNKLQDYSKMRRMVGLLGNMTTSVKRGESLEDIYPEETLKLSAWKIKYYVELWRHRVNKSRFATMRKRLMEQTMAIMNTMEAEKEALARIKSREEADGENFEKFRLALENSGEMQRNEIDNTPELKSPFLNAIMRQHTLEAEKFIPLKTTLEEMRKVLQSVVMQKTRLDSNIEESKRQKILNHKSLALAFKKGLESMDSSILILNKSVSNVHKKCKQRFDSFKFKLSIVNQNVLEKTKQLEVCGHEVDKLQQILQNNVLDHLELRKLDESSGGLSKELADMKMKLGTATMDIEKLNKQKFKIRQQGEKSDKVRENLNMQIEEYRARAVASQTKNEHSTQYTKFLEEQLGGHRSHMHNRPATVGTVGTNSTMIPKEFVRGDDRIESMQMITPKHTKLVNNTIVVLDDTGSKVEEDELDNPKPDGVIMKLKQRLYEDYQEELDETALSARKIISIEQKLKTMALTIDEKMKGIDMKRLLENEDQVMEYSRERIEKDQQYKKLIEEKVLWTNIHKNLEDRKLFILDQTSTIRSSLASARHDIKTFHDSRSMITKAISEWEVQFLQETGRHATPEESETSVGYLYEMLDKLQFDLQERMTIVMEFSAKYRAYQQELHDIEEPIEVSRERSVRGMSPLPRQVPEKFVMTDASAVNTEILVSTVSKGSPRAVPTTPASVGVNANESESPSLLRAVEDNDSAFTPLMANKTARAITIEDAMIASEAASGSKDVEGDLHVHLPTLNSKHFAQRPLSGLEPPNEKTSHVKAPAQGQALTPHDDEHYHDSHHNRHVQKAVEEAESKLSLQGNDQLSNDQSNQPAVAAKLMLDNTKSHIHAAVFGPQTNGATPVREANLLRNRNFDEDVNKVIEDRKLFNVIGRNLEIHKKNSIETFYKMKEHLSSARDDIKALQEEKKLAKLNLAQWRRQWKETKGEEPSKEETHVHSKEFHISNELDSKIKNKLAEMNQDSSSMLDLKHEMDEIDYYIKIAQNRSVRGVSRENRRFPDKYIDVTEPPDTHHSTMFQPISTIDAGVSSSNPVVLAKGGGGKVGV